MLRHVCRVSLYQGALICQRNGKAQMMPVPATVTVTVRQAMVSIRRPSHPPPLSLGQSPKKAQDVLLPMSQE